MKLKSINPKNNLHLSSWDIPSLNEIDLIINDTFNTHLDWKDLNLGTRLNFFKEISNVLKNKIKELSVLMADEMGKPVSQGELEIKKCIWFCDYCNENAKNNIKKKIIETEYHKSYISYQPIGLVLGIMPWNFPFWQVFRFAVPALIVGNGILLKHASNVQGCANEIKNCFIEAGFPKDVFNNLHIPSRMVASLIENNKIAGVAITGSTKAGKAVAKKAGEYLKKTVLELGGNDPYLILDDADITNAVDACINGRLLNAGQSCIAAKRLIITRKNKIKFIEKLKSKLLLKIMGDPLDNVDIGPMVSISAREEVHRQVMQSINAGATLISGGEIPNMEGAYYPITILTNVTPGMPAYDEEIFGPVWSIIVARNNKEAIDIANNTEFGLGSAVFTKNIKLGEKIAEKKIQSGISFVNDYVKSDPRLPFGGIKMSGYGRELSKHGFMEFVNIKTVVVNSI